MSEIKSCFPSRFPNGVILESDFSQLEVVGLAALTMDPVLIQDLLDGRDMHRKFAAERYGITEEEVTSTQRTLTKQMTFQLQYGSGAGGMARKLDIPEADAAKFIDLYYQRYQRVKEWQEEVIEAVRRSRKPTGARTPSGQVQGRGAWESPTGRLYVFLEQDKPDGWKGRDKSADFTPTQIKNYPVQGFATGDIMAVFRARMYRLLLASDLRYKCLPINTVHDSVMYDCVDRESAEQLAALHKQVAESLPQIMMEVWGIFCPVPFKIESKIGPRWSELEKIA